MRAEDQAETGGNVKDVDMTNVPKWHRTGTDGGSAPHKTSVWSALGGVARSFHQGSAREEMDLGRKARGFFGFCRRIARVRDARPACFVRDSGEAASSIYLWALHPIDFE